jgi:hypothetical protein
MRMSACRLLKREPLLRTWRYAADSPISAASLLLTDGVMAKHRPKHCGAQLSEFSAALGLAAVFSLAATALVSDSVRTKKLLA